MEPEGSLPCSQEPSTGPYPQPHQSNPYHPILSKTHFKIVHPPTSWSSQWFLSSGFPTNILCAFLFSPICATFHHWTTYISITVAMYTAEIRVRQRELKEKCAIKIVIMHACMQHVCVISRSQILISDVAVLILTLVFH
jgi:hypothetical protein